MDTYRVVAGYVTVETAVGVGRAQVDIPRGALLPEDVPQEQVTALLDRGHIGLAESKPVRKPAKK